MKLTYAQQADIAIKAVKVCDSVTRRKQIPCASQYARIAGDLMSDKYERVGFRVNKYTQPLYYSIRNAVAEMLARIRSKPKYRLVNGAWVLVKEYDAYFKDYYLDD